MHIQSRPPSWLTRCTWPLQVPHQPPALEQGCMASTFLKALCQWPSTGTPGRNHELAQQVLEGVAAKQHGEELCAIHEVDVQPLCAVLVVALPQLSVAQHLHGGRVWVSQSLPATSATLKNCLRHAGESAEC